MKLAGLAFVSQILGSLTHSHPTEQKIRGFLKLKDGWHRGEGKKFSNSAIVQAIRLHQRIVAAGFLVTDAFPGLNGEVMIVAYYPDGCFEFTLEPSGNWSLVHERGDVEIQEIAGENFERLLQAIPQLNSSMLWITSASFRLNIGTGSAEPLSVSHLNRPSQMGPYRSFNDRVLKNEGYPLAHISASSTRTLPTNLRSFGSSQKHFYQTPRVSTQLQAIPETSATED